MISTTALERSSSATVRGRPIRAVLALIRREYQERRTFRFAVAFDVAFGTRAKKAQIAAPVRLEARRHLAQAGRSADVITVVTALVKLDQVEASRTSAARPLVVIS